MYTPADPNEKYIPLSALIKHYKYVILVGAAGNRWAFMLFLEMSLGMF